MTMQPVDDTDALLDDLLGGDSNRSHGTGPLKELTDAELDRAFREGQITEEQYRTDLKARGVKTESAVNIKVQQNAPTAQKPPGFPAPSFLDPGVLPQVFQDVQTAAANDATSLRSLSESDIIKGVKEGRWTAEEAYRALIEDKGYSPRSAEATLSMGLAPGEEDTSPDLSADNILAGVERGLFSPQDAYRALIEQIGFTPQEAEAAMLLRWQKPGSASLGLGVPGRGMTGTPGAASPVASSTMEGGVQAPRAFGEITGTDYESEAERAAYLKALQGRGVTLDPNAQSFIDSYQGPTQRLGITPPSTGTAGMKTAAQVGGAAQWRDLVARYFPPEHVDKALHVIEYESGGRNIPQIGGGPGTGLFQIEHGGAHPGRLSQQELLDPETNVRVAAEMASKNWNQWTDWGEETLYNGKPFGALGHHPYQRGVVLR